MYADCRLISYNCMQLKTCLRFKTPEPNPNRSIYCAIRDRNYWTWGPVIRLHVQQREPQPQTGDQPRVYSSPTLTTEGGPICR